VTYDEELRSYKAIAFIESLTVPYVKLGATPQQNALLKNKPIRQLSKRYGEFYGQN
jgi:hypothetical protein